MADDFQKLYEEVDKLKKERTSILASINSAKEELDRFNGEAKLSERYIVKLQEKIALLESEAKSKQEVISNVLKDLDNNKFKKEQELNDIIIEKNSNLSIIDANVAELLSKKNDILNSIDNLQSSYKVLEKSYNERKKELSDLDSKIVLIKGDISILEAKKSELSTIDENIKKSNNQLLMIKDDIKILNQDKLKISSEIEKEELSLKNIKENSQSIKKELEKEISELLEKSQDAKIKYEDAKKEMESKVAETVRASQLRDTVKDLLNQAKDIYKQAGLQWPLDE